jgi:hypothetical protein
VWHDLLRRALCSLLSSVACGDWRCLIWLHVQCENAPCAPYNIMYDLQAVKKLDLTINLLTMRDLVISRDPRANTTVITVVVIRPSEGLAAERKLTFAQSFGTSHLEYCPAPARYGYHGVLNNVSNPVLNFL